MHDEDGEIDVKVEFQKADKRTLDQLQNLKLYRGTAEPIKLATLVTLIILPEIYLLLDDLHLWFRRIVQSARHSHLTTNPQS